MSDSYFSIVAPTPTCQTTNPSSAGYCLNGTCVNGSCVPTPIPTPTITVTSPNGGETWNVGETHNVTWTTSGVSSDNQVNIGIEDYYTGHYTLYSIATVPANQGIYSWTIPTMLESTFPLLTGTYEIKIGAVNGKALGIQAGSSANPFTIVASASACISDGNSVPFGTPDSQNQQCCAGLTLIKPTSPNMTGTSGICTAKCGNGICDSGIETYYNCPQDCKIIVPPVPPVPSPACISNWKIGAWGFCAVGKQTRTVTDLSNCTVPSSAKPATTQSCIFKPPVVPSVPVIPGPVSFNLQDQNLASISDALKIIQQEIQFLLGN